MTKHKQREAVRYINRIRNAKKREYATQYFALMLGLRDTHPAHACSAMAAQAVRLNLLAIKDN